MNKRNPAAWRKAVCANCERPFQKRTSRPPSQRDFCSASCQKACRAGSANPKWKGGPASKTCEHCGVPFQDEGYTGKRYCTPACKAEAQKKPLDAAAIVALLEDFDASELTLDGFAKRVGSSAQTLRLRFRAACPDAYDAVMERRRKTWDQVYKLGRRFEYDVRLHLIACGFVCMVSPRSMGPADLMAAKAGLILLVQCKHAGRLKAKERRALIECSKAAGGLPLLASKLNGSIELWQVPTTTHGRLSRYAIPLTTVVRPEG